MYSLVSILCVCSVSGNVSMCYSVVCYGVGVVCCGVGVVCCGCLCMRLIDLFG